MPTIDERARAAADTATTTGALRDYATDRSTKVREAVALNPSTPADVLQVLVRDERSSVRLAVAENPGSQALAVALGAEDPDTRGGVAQREDLDAASMHLMLKDPVHTVRERLAEVAADETVVAALARDSHPVVRAAIVLNPYLSDSDLERLAQDPIAQVRASAAASRRLAPETLTGLAGDPSSHVRWSVLVGNPERLDLARTIADDSDEMNASQAKAQLERPRDFTESLGDIELLS